MVLVGLITLKDHMKRRVTVTAISEDEVVGLLQRLNLYDIVVSGKATCFICGRVVTLSNIGGLLEVNKRTVLICSKPSCIAKAALLSRGFREKEHMTPSHP